MKHTVLCDHTLSMKDLWSVSNVMFKNPNEKMTIQVSFVKKGLKYPKFKKNCYIHDSHISKWKHLDTCQFSTFIEAEIPGVNYPKNCVHQINIP